MFLVQWIQSALDDLIRIWLMLDSTGRGAITQAAHQIDIDLADAADTVGEGRTGNLRVHYVAPLGLTFDVDARSSTVYLVKLGKISVATNKDLRSEILPALSGADSRTISTV